MHTATVVKKAYYRMVPVVILGLAVVALNGLVDGLVTGRLLGTEAMAAITLFGPISTAIGLSYVITSGVQILCGELIGTGDGEKVISLFSTCLVFLGAISVGITALLYILQNPMAYALGAKGVTATMLCGYVRGYAPGIIGQVFSGAFMMFLPLNHDEKRSYIGIVILVVSNTLLNLLFVGPLAWGTFGLGLATALSYLLSSGYMFTGFLKKEKVIRFRFGKFCFGEMKHAAYLGLPHLMFTLGNVGKTLVMNQAVMTRIGSDAVAVMNVQGSVCGLAGSIPQGVSTAFLVLGSIYYGEEDRSSLIGALRTSLIGGVLLSALTMGGLMLLSPVLPSAFSLKGDAFTMCTDMLLLFPSFLVLNTLFNLFLKTYQCQGQMKIVNTLPLIEQIATAVFAVAGLYMLGVNAIWASFSLANGLMLIVIAILVFVRAKKITFSLPQWMRLDPDFGAKEGECLEFALHSMDEVTQISERIIDFCQQRGIEHRKCNLAGLFVEEMAGNVVQHGFLPGEEHSVDVRLVAKEALTIRVRDDCRAFDPKKRVEQFSHEDPTKNVGIRMIAKLAEEMRYQNYAGINSLLIKV